MKRSFFQALFVSILLYGGTNGCELNVWRKSLTVTTQECCEQYWTSPGGSTAQSSSCTATYHSSRKLFKLDEHDSWRGRDELISDKLLWTPSHERTKTGRPVRIYVQKLCADTRCCPEDLLETMVDREGWRERVMSIRADGATWSWRWWYHRTIWLILASLFEWHINLLGLFIAKVIPVEGQLWYCLTHNWWR